MGLGSFFKKKKKEVEEGVSNVESMIKQDVQPENELKEMNLSFTEEKENMANTKNGSQLQIDEGNLVENGHSSSSEPKVSKMTVKEVNVNIDSDLLKKAEASGIDLSKTLEQQLKRMVSESQ